MKLEMRTRVYVSQDDKDSDVKKYVDEVLKLFNNKTVYRVEYYTKFIQYVENFNKNEKDFEEVLLHISVDYKF